MASLYNTTTGTFTSFTDPSARQFFYAYGISGTNVVGYYANGVENGFLYNTTGITYTIIDDPLSHNTTATGIDGDNIVGYYYDANNNSHGFLAKPGTSPQISLKNCGSGMCPTSVLVGDPINVGAGNLFENQIDFTSAPETQLSFTRSYNSTDPSSARAAVLA